jgi:hypothetical protein
MQMRRVIDFVNFLPEVLHVLQLGHSVFAKTSL